MKILIIAIIVIILILAALCAGFLLTLREYKKVFGSRMADPTGFTQHYFDLHPELEHSGFSCTSDRGTTLRGLRLLPPGAPRALIVMTHGYNLSCENYLPLARRFTRAGFAVLMFDGVGCGMSDGQSVYGLPQHVLDMRSVLECVQKDPDLNRLPLLLFGHSWGGYAAACVSCLARYPLKGILTCAAFRKSSSSMAPTIRRRYPGMAPLFLFLIETIDRFSFGKTAGVTSSAGIRAAGCPARLYHSDDDRVVSFEESFLQVEKELSDLSGVSFVGLSGRNHDLFLAPENDRRQLEIHRELWTASEAAERTRLTEELWKLMSETDSAMAEEFLGFFDSCLTN